MPIPMSLIIACYCGEQLTHSQEFVLPEVEHGVKLLYFLDSAVEADVVKAFYVDRVPAVRPHVIRVSLE
jgi:hypothetical protein